MTYADEVLDVFVNEISTKLNIDFSWILDQSNEYILKYAVKYQDKLKECIRKKLLCQNNIPFYEKLFELQDVLVSSTDIFLLNLDYISEIVNCIYELSEGIIDIFDLAYVVLNSHGVEIVICDVNSIVKYKNSNSKIKSLAQLAAEKYVRNNQEIFVTFDVFEKAKLLLNRKEELRDEVAQELFDELTLASFSHLTKTQQIEGVEIIVITFLDRAEEKLQKIANYLLVAESQIYYKEKDVPYKLVKSLNYNVNEFMFFIVGRCVIEIRLAWAEKSIDLSTRIENVIGEAKANFKEVFEEGFFKSLSKFVIDYIVNMLSGLLKNIYQAIRKGGEYFRIICDEMWLFVSDGNRTLLQTLVNISKTIAGLALLTFTIGFHQYLLSAGVPELLVVVLTAFISSLITVAIFRLIEQVAKITSGVFYQRDIARIRRVEVERICEELLPFIDEKIIQLEILIEQENKERKDVFDKTFAQIKASLALAQIDDIISAYEGLYQYLGKELPFSNEEEFDSFMTDGNAFVL